jgi:hypothetical protein
LTERTWVGTASGPMLLLPDSLLDEWSGIDVPASRTVRALFRWNLREARASDYDRACDVEDYAGVIPVGYGEGLVMTESLRATAWVPQPWGGYFVRRPKAIAAADAERVLAHLPAASSWTAVEPYVVVGTPLSLFNSAEPGMEQVMDRLQVELAPGRYEVRWTRPAPDASEIGVVELRRGS